MKLYRRKANATVSQAHRAATKNYRHSDVGDVVKKVIHVDNPTHTDIAIEQHKTAFSVAFVGTGFPQVPCLNSQSGHSLSWTV